MLLLLLVRTTPGRVSTCSSCCRLTAAQSAAQGVCQRKGRKRAAPATEEPALANLQTRSSRQQQQSQQTMLTLLQRLQLVDVMTAPWLLSLRAVVHPWCQPPKQTTTQGHHNPPAASPSQVQTHRQYPCSTSHPSRYRSRQARGVQGGDMGVLLLVLPKVAAVAAAVRAAVQLAAM